MSDGSITFSTELDNKDLERELSKLKKEIRSLETDVSKNSNARSPLIEQAEQIEKSMAEARAEAERYRLEWMSGMAGADRGEIAAQEKAVQLKAEYDGVLQKIEKYDNQIEKSNGRLDDAKAKAGELSKQLAAVGENSQKMGEAVKKADGGMAKFARRVQSVVYSALVFTVITQALAKLREWIGDVIKTNSEAESSIARLKAALLTLAQPLITIVIPAFVTFVNVLTRIINAIAGLVSRLFGSTLSASKEAAKNLNKETSALKGVGSAAKKAGDSLASFDEINQISTDTGSGGGASSGGISPDFSDSQFDSDEYKQKIDEITTYASGALLALGVILAFSGINIPLGLALIFLGAVGLASVIAENWNAMDGKVGKAINAVLLVLGVAGLAIGAILAFSGINIPLGIGLMLTGAAALGTAVALNWTTIVKSLQGPIGAIIAAISGILLVLGMVLAFSGASLPIGIALMVAGAAGLATVTALNWDKVSNTLKGPVGKIVAMASAALLVLGILLCLSGVGIPLGIALIAAGAVGLVTVTALNWNAILDKLKGVWDGIKNWWNSSVKKYFTIAFWSEKFACIGEGLERKVKDGVNAAIALFNRFIGWVNEKMHFSWGDFSLFGKKVISAGGFQLFTLPEIPYLAQGAVIPPNREFMAVLGDQTSGTNIEAPASLIKQMVEEALAEAGASGEQEITINLTTLLDGEVVYKNQERIKARRGRRVVGNPALL